ncbi:chemotaxis protein CheX [Ramlibacter sp. WS9]|uniref:chemotaxis protein CheX n=1 Tax=Ramlibacter sp. WS9 TaxID=1882741 RepID=UPI001E5DE1E6|nr:chemotaxis protein CheX [Ramlibacter sp. WS9]
MMDALHETELKLFVDSVRRYFQVVTKQEPQITSAFLGTGDVDGHDFNGIVTFSGTYNGHVMVSMPPQLLKELLLLQGETDLSESNLLDAVGEIANTLGGNARKTLGAGLNISVPMKLHGSSGVRARVRKHPYVITLRWNHQPAMVCVDMEKRH